ncbi:hypothetical protein DSO57_1005180 [Entomophthora muscae]|uniref:Uncharacterized protein n=1 Tax=Entomophthora muscae TaxID=34485 RepID=A0ACC2SKM2_9FUNG|nr:hypothetical protein DSO57_1005180 [Entomophthora muscae]
MYWGSGLVVALAVSIVSLTAVYLKYVSKSAPSDSRSLFSWLFHLLQNKPLDVASRWIWEDFKGESKIVDSLQSGSWGRVVASQSAAFQILGNNKKFPKKLIQDSLLGTLFGTTLLLSNGDTWRRHRQVLAPPFRKLPSIQHIAVVMQEVFAAIEDEPNRKPVDVFRLMQRMSLDFFAKALFGMDSNTVRGKDKDFLDGFNSLVYEAFDPLELALPWVKVIRSHSRTTRAMRLASLNAFVESMIESRVSSFPEGLANAAQRSDEDCDVLSLMFKASRDGEIGFTRSEMRDNIAQLFLPTITTASTLTHVLHHIARDQGIQKRLRAEVRILSLASPVPTADQINQMVLLSAVIKETMRLSPAFAQLPTRVTTEMCLIDGMEFSPGTDIVIDLFAMQRDPEYYEEPLKFDPERFMVGDDRLPWLSFGGGMRVCIGLRVALLELKVAIAMLVSRYDIAYPPGSTPLLDPALAACQLMIPLDVDLILTPISDY